MLQKSRVSPEDVELNFNRILKNCNFLLFPEIEMSDQTEKTIVVIGEYFKIAVSKYII